MVCEESECVDVSDSYFNLEIQRLVNQHYLFSRFNYKFRFGDQIGIYDMAGIVDSTGVTGMILVGLELGQVHNLKLLQLVQLIYQNLEGLFTVQ